MAREDSKRVRDHMSGQGGAWAGRCMGRAVHGQGGALNEAWHGAHCPHLQQSSFARRWPPRPSWRRRPWTFCGVLDQARQCVQESLSVGQVMTRGSRLNHVQLYCVSCARHGRGRRHGAEP